MFAPIKFAAAAIALTAVSAPAFAETFESNGKTVEVYHGDLDLTKGSDQRLLRKRIADAAGKVCASDDLNTYLACRQKALRHVKAPVATAIARAATKDRYAAAGKAEPVIIGGN